MAEKKKGKKEGVRETLTSVGKKILSHLRENPKDALLGAVELSEKISISTAQYYRLFSEPRHENFREEYKALISATFTRASFPISEKMVQQALRGSFPQQRLIMEAVGAVSKEGVVINIGKIVEKDKEKYK